MTIKFTDLLTLLYKSDFLFYNDEQIFPKEVIVMENSINVSIKIKGSKDILKVVEDSKLLSGFKLKVGKNLEGDIDFGEFNLKSINHIILSKLELERFHLLKKINLCQEILDEKERSSFQEENSKISVRIIELEHEEVEQIKKEQALRLLNDYNERCENLHQALIKIKYNLLLFSEQKNDLLSIENQPNYKIKINYEINKIPA